MGLRSRPRPSGGGDDTVLFRLGGGGKGALISVTDEPRRDKNGLTEEEFLAVYRTKNYPKPALTADVVIVAQDGGEDYVLLIRRGGHPYLGCWAFPGGFADPDECIARTARRELLEETGLEGLTMVPVGLFSQPGRDPRGWVVSQVYAARVQRASCKPVAGDDAAQTVWFRLERRGEELRLENGGTVISFRAAPEGDGWAVAPTSAERLAFDHAQVLAAALDKLG